MFCAAALFALTMAPLVTNWEGGETVHYPLVIIEGQAKGESVTVAGTECAVVDGRYVGVAELRQGSNSVEIKDDQGHAQTLTLNFQEPKTEHRVRIWFVAANDEPFKIEDGNGGYSTDYVKRIDTMAKLIQSMTAEMMRVAGYGRKTFALELNQNSRVDVQIKKHSATGRELRALDGNKLWYKMNEWLGPRMDGSKIKNCFLAGFSRWDAKNKRADGHTALGGGYLGYFGSSSMFTWPESPSDIAKKFTDSSKIDTNFALDDSAFRATVWGSSSTTIGAVLHEMGHTFGLPHTSDSQGIMSRGFDFTNRWFVMTEPPSGRNASAFTIKPEQRPRWAKESAAALNASAWFQSDGVVSSSTQIPELSERCSEETIR